MWSLTRAHFCQQEALVMTTFSNLHLAVTYRGALTVIIIYVYHQADLYSLDLQHLF